jgi:hypothetical protein
MSTERSSMTARPSEGTWASAAGGSIHDTRCCRSARSRPHRSERSVSTSGIAAPISGGAANRDYDLIGDGARRSRPRRRCERGTAGGECPAADIQIAASRHGAPLRAPRALARRRRAQRDDRSAQVDAEVGFDRGTRALYATDSSNYRQVPIGVVVPRTTEALIATVALCREHGAPIFPRGGGTSLAGQSCNEAVVIDCSRHLTQVTIDRDARTAEVGPGTIMKSLRDAANAVGLEFGPDPSTKDRCTLGGMLGNNSCGVHSVFSEFYGPGPRTSDHVEQLEILTYWGERMTVGATDAAGLARIRDRGGTQAAIYELLLALCARYEPLIRARFPTCRAGSRATTCPIFSTNAASTWGAPWSAVRRHACSCSAHA